MQAKKRGILRGPPLLFRSLPAVGLLFGFRVGPLPHPSLTHLVLPAVHTDRDDPSFTHPVLPAVHTDRDYSGRRGYRRPSAASCAGTAIVDGSVKDAGGLDLHPFAAGVA